MTEIEIGNLVAKLREVKQKVYNDSVEGNPSRPDEVVDLVALALRELLPDTRRLYNEVVAFYPDYTG
jgi:hypothetical protein